MQDHLHDYNIAVRHARRSHRKAVEAAARRRVRALAVIETAYRQALANAAGEYLRAMTAAEDNYHEAQAAAGAEPPF